MRLISSLFLLLLSAQALAEDPYISYEVNIGLAERHGEEYEYLNRIKIRDGKYRETFTHTRRPLSQSDIEQVNDLFRQLLTFAQTNHVSQMSTRGVARYRLTAELDSDTGNEIELEFYFDNPGILPAHVRERLVPSL